ncbi:MAG: hypothetical protein ACFFC7_10605, partial [Candidatus Hermodarchaeota archaeon]
ATKADYRTRLDPVTLEPEIYQLTIWADWQGYSTSQVYFIEVVDGSFFFTDPVVPSSWQNTSQVVVGITITDNLTGIQGNTIGYRLAYITIGQKLTEQSWQALTGYSNAASITVEETLHLLYDGEIRLEWRVKAINGLEYGYSPIYTLLVDTQVPRVHLNYLTNYQRCGVQLKLDEEKGSEIEEIKINYQILNSSQWKQLKLISPQIKEEVEVWITTKFPELLISVQVSDEAGNMFHSSPTHISLPTRELIPPSEPMAEILTFGFILGTFVSIRKYFSYKKQKEGFSVP